MNQKYSALMQTFKRCLLTLTVSVAFTLPVYAQTNITYFETGEEFCGPFPSWKNVKTDYGAKADGSDDAPEINTALTAMKNMNTNTWSVLYFPAGTYHINSTISNSPTLRVNGDDFSGMTVIGEDPATTVILWEGASGGKMMLYDGWYGKMSRLTFDGNNSAGVGISRDGGFSTGTEFSDMVFKNITGNGLDLSAPINGNGQAETSILRCKFISCTKGIIACNWNSLDEYVWYSLFQDCGTAIDQCIGSFQIFGNVFLRSTVADIGGQAVYSEAVVNNISIGSKVFAAMSVGYLGGNKIYNSTTTNTLQGTRVMFDNVVRSSATSGSVVSYQVEFTYPNSVKRAVFPQAILAGNTFTVSNPVSIKNEPTVPNYLDSCALITFEQKIVSQSSIVVPTTVSLPGTPQKKNRVVYEVANNSSDAAAEIQAKIMQACTSSTAGVNPIVHIPKGSYSLKRTILVPSKKAVQIIGDGTENGTIFTWGGTTAGPGMRFMGPSRVTMRDVFFNFNNTTADVLLIDKVDNPAGGRVFCDGVHGGGYTAGRESDVVTLVDRADNIDVTFRNGGFSCFTGGGVVVKGGRTLSTGGTTPYQVDYLAGALGNQPDNLFDVRTGGKLIALGFRDETPMEGSQINLTPASSGTLCVGAMSWAMTPSPTKPLCKIDGFNGTFTFIGNAIGKGYTDNSGSIFFQISGNGQNTKVLNACNAYASQNTTTSVSAWKDNSSPAAQATMFNCYGGPVNGTGFRLPTVVNKTLNVAIDTNKVRDMVAHFRTLRTDPPLAKPDSVTDVKLIRVRMFTGTGRNGLTIKGDTSYIQGVLDSKIVGMNAGSSSMCKIGMGMNSVHIPAGVKSIMVYNVAGQLVLSRNVTRATDMRLATERIESIGKHGVAFVKFLK